MTTQFKHFFWRFTALACTVGFLGIPNGASTWAITPTQSVTEKAEALLQEQNWKATETLLKSKLQADPHNKSFRDQLFQLYLLSDKAEEAKKLIPPQDKSWTSLFDLAQILLGPPIQQSSEGISTDTKAELKAVIAQTKRMQTLSADALYIRGSLAKLSEESIDAETDLLSALLLNPNHVLSLQNVADLYLNQNNLDLAKPNIAQLLDLAPSDPMTWYLAGRLFYAKGDPENALEAFKKSEHLDPLDRYNRLYWMAKTYQQLGQTENASQVVATITQTWPEKTELWKDSGLPSPQVSPLQVTTFNITDGKQDTQNWDTQAQDIFWEQSPQDALRILNQWLNAHPTDISKLVLVSQIHYSLWQQGQKIKSDSLSLLQQRILKHPQFEKSDLLKFASIQLQVVSQQSWKETLNEQALQLLSKTKDAWLKARIAILMGQPNNAISAYHSASKSPSPIQAQLMALSGAWPWAKQLANQLPQIQQYAGRINALDANASQLAADQIQEASLSFKSKQWQKAQAAIEKAQVLTPLSSSVYLAFAQWASLQNQPEALAYYLQQCQALGLNPQNSGLFAQFKKRECPLIK